MVSAALAEGPSLPGLTAQARQYCSCGGGSEVSCTVGCSDKRVYAEVTTRLSFNTGVSYALIPNPIPLSSKAAMRAK